jgi:Tripartite tricarboxylate transporter family receptor
LNAVAYRLAVLQPDGTALIEGKFSVDQVSVVFQQPLNPQGVAVENFLIRLQHQSSANAINTALYDKLNYNFLRDLAPVAGICHTPLVMVVHPSFPAKTVPEFIAYAKANPSKINMASIGNGTTPHVVGEVFKMMTGLALVHVPYRGGGAGYLSPLTAQSGRATNPVQEFELRVSFRIGLRSTNGA